MSTYSEEYKQRFIDLAISTVGPVHHKDLIAQIGPTDNGVTPRLSNISIWLRRAGVSVVKPLPGDRWTPEQRAEVLEMVMGEGLHITTAMGRMRKNHGGSPSRGKVLEWLPPEFVAQYNVTHPSRKGSSVLAMGSRSLWHCDSDADEARTARMCKTHRARLWWSAETSENPRWNPKARRLAA